MNQLSCTFSKGLSCAQEAEREKELRRQCVEAGERIPKPLHSFCASAAFLRVVFVFGLGAFLFCIFRVLS